jgi:hypothetical protein
MTDQQIVSLLKINNRVGIKYLYEKYKNSLQNMITDFLPGLSEQKKEEIVIAVMVQIWLLRGRIPDKEHIFSCMAVMVKHEITKLKSQLPIRKRTLRKQEAFCGM